MHRIAGKGGGVNIVCGGDHCRDIVEIAHRLNVNPTVYDDNPETGIPTPPDNLRGPLIIGINDPATRRQIAERFPNARAAAPLIDPSAVVGSDCHLSPGTVIGPQTVLGLGVRLAKHCHVNYHVSMTRANLGAFCTVSPGVTVCGNVDIGDEVWLGAGSVICDRVRIGNSVLVAAGAIIPPESEVPDGAKVIGVWKP